MVDEELRRSAAHVLVASLEHPTLDAADAHHLGRVLRLKSGEVVTATDGRGRWRRCIWRDDALELDGDTRVDDVAGPPVTIGFAPVKGDRPEWAAQKLTELGVDRMVILEADRSVVRWQGERGRSQMERLRRVAREATLQARRCHVPRIEGPMSPADLGGALAHFGGEPVSLTHPVLMIGPEGGWSEAELAGGRPRVSLGSTVLRAETAAVAAGVLLTSLREAGR